MDLLKAKYELLAKTNMVDFISMLYKNIHNTEDVPAGIYITHYAINMTRNLLFDLFNSIVNTHK